MTQKYPKIFVSKILHDEKRIIKIYKKKIGFFNGRIWVEASFWSKYFGKKNLFGIFFRFAPFILCLIWPKIYEIWTKNLT